MYGLRYYNRINISIIKNTLIQPLSCLSCKNNRQYGSLFSYFYGHTASQVAIPVRLSRNTVITTHASTSSGDEMEEKTGKCKTSVRESARLIGAKISRTHGHEFYEDTSHKTIKADKNKR